MKLKILADYIEICKTTGEKPTFEGLNKYEKQLKGGK